MADDYTIKVDGYGRGQIIRNGVEMTNVVSFMVEGGANRMTEITLTMNKVSADISCEGFASDYEGKPN